MYICRYIYIYIYIHTCVYIYIYIWGSRFTLRGWRSTLHSCHILPFQPILWNTYFPPEPANTAKHRPKSISEGGRIWQVCAWKPHRDVLAPERSRVAEVEAARARRHGGCQARSKQRGGPLIVRICPLFVRRLPLIVRRFPYFVRRLPLIVRRCPLTVNSCPLFTRRLPVIVRRCPLIIRSVFIISNRKI